MSGAAGRQLGGEVQTLALPGGADTMFTAPAVLHRPGLTQAFVATSGGTTAYSLAGGRLRVDWKNGSAGTSPVLAGGLLWVYDPDGGLNVYRPDERRAESGTSRRRRGTGTARSWPAVASICPRATRTTTPPAAS